METKENLKLASLQLIIQFPKDAELITKVKRLSGRRWDKQNQYWAAPLTVENIRKLVEAGIEINKDIRIWYNSQQ